MIFEAMPIVLSGESLAESRFFGQQTIPTSGQPGVSGPQIFLWRYPS